MRLDDAPVPHSWAIVPLESIITGLRGGVSVSGINRAASSNEPGVLKLSAVSYGLFRPSENKAVIGADASQLGPSVRKDTILISRSNTTELVGACVYIETDFPRLYLPDLIWEVEVSPESGNYARWLAYVLASPGVRRDLVRTTTGTSASMKKLSMSSLRSLRVLRPPLNEQRCIAQILSAWDRAIALSTRLLQWKNQHKTSLLQSLLGTTVQRGVKVNWRAVHFRDVTSESRERNLGRMDLSSVKAVNKSHGLIPMRERVAAESLDRYKIVPPQGFAYNPMRLNIGSLAMSTESADVLVSPDYVVFTCNEGQLDPEYLNHYRRTHAWTKFVEVAGNGSVRVRIYYRDLGTMRLKLPAIDEQRRIANVLSTCDREIELLERQLDAFKTQKTGLMQKLLTGQIRTIRQSR